MSKEMTLDEARLLLQWGPSRTEDADTAFEKLIMAESIIKSAVENNIISDKEAKDILLHNPQAYISMYSAEGGGFC